MSHYRSSTGFTLLEVLVVLVITSLISFVLIYAFSYVTLLRNSFINQINILQKGAMQETWFRQSIKSITLTKSHATEDHFLGKPHFFECITLSPLNAYQGTPIRIRWSINNKLNQYQLNYEELNEQDNTWDIMSWEYEKARFQYVSHTGKHFNQWPPNLGSTKRKLPTAIIFHGVRKQKKITWFMNITSPDKVGIDLQKWWDH